MLPRRPAQIFRSRWSALFWAVSVILFAVMTIGFGKSDGSGNTQAQQNDTGLTDALGDPVSNEDLATLKHVIDGQ